MKEIEVKQINTTALAYLGDSVYEVAVREHLIKTGQVNADRLHRLAVRFVRAEAQALAVRELFPQLTDSEQHLVKRARNRKTSSKPKNADPVIYKLATAFEALIGYLYLSEQRDRLDWIISRAIQAINELGAEYVKRKEKSTK